MATGKSTDWTSLVARARAGDRTALDALVRALQPMISALSRRFLMIPADAEDATQEILVRIVTRLAQFDGRSKFTTWAYAVASRHLLDLKRRPTEQAMSFDDFGADLADGLADTSRRDPDMALMLEEVRVGCTLALLQCLERDARLSYILGEIMELDHREAAEVLGISAAAYRKRLSRARADITAFMMGHCGLANPENPCRCGKRLARAVDLGRVDPDNPVFARSRRHARRFPEVLAEIRRLQTTQRAAALYRAQEPVEASDRFIAWLRATLDRHERDRPPPEKLH